MSIYASDPRKRPDSDFEPGELHHLVAGVPGRMLDPRRTPVSVVEVRPEVGFVDIRVEGFEDEGARWAIPLEKVGHFQFEPAGPRATDAEVAEMEAAIARFDHEETIEADADARRRTESRITACQAEADRWLDGRSRFLAAGGLLPDPSERRGDPELAVDLEGWLRGQDLWDLEEPFAQVFVSNPGSGEIVKGHRIVLAELGLADYVGGVVRDPSTFEGGWTRERRAEHIVARLAFVRALFGRVGLRELRVWRGASIEDRLEARPGRTFVSSSCDAAVARDHYQGGAPEWTHVLVCQDVPVERLFMTYHETAAMNSVFLEAEAVLFACTGDGWP